MKRILTILTILTVFLLNINAQGRGLISSQRYNSGGYLFFSAGPAYCYTTDTKGDLYTESPFYNGNNWNASLGFKQIFPENFGYRVNLIYGNYVGADTNSKHHTSFYSFSSNILELTVRAEYTIKFGGEFKFRKPNSIYGFVGLGGFISDVKSVPFGTYVIDPVINSTVAAIIPAGFGYQYEFRNGLTLGAEAGIQYGLSDALDGYIVAKSSNDILANLSFTIGYKIF